MKFSKLQQSAFALLAIALVLVLLVSVTLPARAELNAPAHNSQSVLLVPTPITTPSALDALALTSDLTVGGNATVAGTLGITGAVTGNVLRYPTASRQMLCGTQTITGTGTIAHGLATPQAVVVSLGSDATGDGASVSSTNSSATVTAKVWNTALTPAAATTPVTVNWCVIGSP